MRECSSRAGSSGLLARQFPSNYNLLMDAEGLRTQLDRDGFGVIPECLGSTALWELRERLRESHEPTRNLLSIAEARALATSREVREIAEAVLGRECFAVRGIFFNKTRTANWKVVWHQDLTIAVCERVTTDGFGPWTMKAGVVHVQPPADVMAGMLAVRLHLDDSDEDNGPLRVIAGTHHAGRLSSEAIAAVHKSEAVVCVVPAGGAIVMRPLVLHASSESTSGKSRRVLHFEFAAAELPNGLRWYEKV
jgi:ectoine hydroxylase-related dioxygenase (phytanoyl-CoA dioxygenase family)